MKPINNSWAVRQYVIGMVLIVLLAPGAAASDQQPPSGYRQVVSDLKKMYQTTPTIDKQKAWPFLLITAAVMANDEALFRDLRRATGPTFNNKIAPKVETMGHGAFGALVCILTYQSGDPRKREAALMGAEALIYAGINTQALKYLTGRRRPTAGSDSQFTWLSSEDHSFPSGHTSGAFALATVFAESDRRHRTIYYTLASLVGLARVAHGKHWPGDVLAGAGLGIISGKQAMKVHQGEWTLPRVAVIGNKVTYLVEF